MSGFNPTLYPSGEGRLVRMTFALWPGQVEATNNACERDLRPAVVQRKVTNGYRAMWAAQGEADVRTVIDTARLKPSANRFQTILAVVST